MTASGVVRRRGEPLAALVLVVASWTGVRAMLWDTPGGLRPRAVAPFALASTEESERPVPALARSAEIAPERTAARSSPPAVARPARVAGAVATLAVVRRKMPPDMGFPTWRPAASAPLVPLAPALAAPAPASPSPLERSSMPVVSRWRVDGWAAWRQGSELPRIAAGARPAAYGGSQAGLAARYALAAGGKVPALHLRASYAPDRPRQAELALGAGARPIGRFPLRVLAELRGAMSEGRTELRPAAFAVTELEPVELPLGLAVEAYAQAGWVGGRYATPFADGQARVTRAALRVGPARLSAGAGAWGGAQRFAERLDVGPTLELALPEAPAPLRLSLDYRIRVAGNAVPGNGVAVTLASGF